MARVKNVKIVSYDEIPKDLLEKTKQEYIDCDGDMTPRVVARRLGRITESMAKRVIKEWDKEINVRIELSKETEEFIKEGPDKLGLSDKERAFCYNYMKTFNKATAAVAAGYSPNSPGNAGKDLLSKPRIKKFLRELKAQRDKELLIDSIDIINQYTKIAFSDISEVAEFGSKDVPITDSYGNPVYNKDTGEILTKNINFVKLKNNAEVDGQLISEIKVESRGTTVKMVDKLAALDKLAQFFDIFGKRGLEDAKLQIMKDKLELERLKLLGDDDEESQEGVESFLSASSPTEDQIKVLFSEKEGDDTIED